ncbi:hypothetical protein V6R21_01660 [Limibacter armeniacum]|uniref:hypothetical protein n=1 Tax=Limibacter armeniacum TaxID=466084 RepID=UPI002FE6156B
MMKQVFIWIAVLGLMFTACEKSDNQEIDPVVTYQLVEASPVQLEQPFEMTLTFDKVYTNGQINVNGWNGDIYPMPTGFQNGSGDFNTENKELMGVSFEKLEISEQQVKLQWSDKTNARLLEGPVIYTYILNKQ